MICLPLCHAYHFSCLAKTSNLKGRNFRYIYVFKLNVNRKNESALAVFAFLATRLTRAVLQELVDAVGRLGDCGLFLGFFCLFLQLKQETGLHRVC